MPVDVDVLIHEHKQAVHTVDGIEIHSVPSLISQLHDAIFGGMESTGGSAPGSRLPISAGALDLYMTIDRQIAEAWVEAFKRVPGTQTPEALLAEWAVWADPETIVTVEDRGVYAKDAATGWADRIRTFFDPPRNAEIQAECIQCGTRYVYGAEDGQTVRRAALTFTRDRETGATLYASCGHCGALWYPHQFDFLAKAIGIDVDAKKADFEEQHAGE